VGGRAHARQGWHALLCRFCALCPDLTDKTLQYVRVRTCPECPVAGIGSPQLAYALLWEDLLTPDRAAMRFYTEFSELAAAALTMRFTVLHILSDSYDALLQGLVSHK